MTATTTGRSVRRSPGVPGEFHVLHAVPPRSPTAADLRLLSPEQRRRAERIRAPAAAARHVTGRALLGRLLADLLGVAPHQVALVVAPNGRVEVPDAPDLRVSISHTEGMVVVAAADTAVGIDVERADRWPLPPLSQWLSPAELERLGTNEPLAATDDPAPGRLPDGHDRHRRLVRTWTAKEATLKASGCLPGLVLADVEVARGKARIPDRTGDNAGATWHLHDLLLASTHVTTLAATSPAPCNPSDPARLEWA